MEGKASGGGYILRGLLGKDGVHRGVFQSIVLRVGEEKGAGMVGTEQQSCLGCQDEELALHPKGKREPWQNLEQERGLGGRGRAWNASPCSPDRGSPASSHSAPSRNKPVRAFSGPPHLQNAQLCITDLFCIPEVHQCSSRFVTVFQGTLWCSIKKIEAPYVFDWEYGIALHAMQGNRASFPSEGDI